MPKASIKYDLDNYDDEMAYRRANASLGMACFIHEVLLNGKRRFEHGTTIDNIWEPVDYTCKRSAFEIFEQAKDMYKAEKNITEDTSDGYHTFKELYDFRKAYNVALFNEWGKYDIPTYDVHKSWKHHDKELCFGGGWFIVVAVLPTGQISNHYPASDWDLFKIPETESAKYPFDGHTGQDVIKRLLKI